MDEIKNAIIEAKTGFELVLPSPDDFFIDMAEDLNKPKSVNAYILSFIFIMM
jgi:hypothetical protein